MKYAILIVTYSSAIQTKRLINSLNNGCFDFYIHVDKKLDIETHRELFKIPNVFFIKNRIDISWGGYTLVEAILSGVKQIAATGIKYDFIKFISGQDYPIKSAEYITNFFNQNIGKEFILYEKFNTDWTEAKTRVEKYHFTDLKFKGKHHLEDILNFFAPKRRWPVKLELYGKETFWLFSLDCAVYILNYIESNKQLQKFLRYTWGSDEFIFHTILMDSPFKANVVNKNYHYVNWPPEGGSRPNFFVASDFDKIMASEDLFGRKFDINTDENILNLLDKANNS